MTDQEVREQFKYTLSHQEIEETPITELRKISNAQKEEQMSNLDSHLKLLGLKVRDVVTGFTGIATCVSFDLYGCVQAVVKAPAPEPDKDGKLGSEFWFDTKRLRPLDNAPVMGQPTFAAVPGGSEHPPFESKPLK